MMCPSSIRTTCVMNCGGTRPTNPAVSTTPFTLLLMSAPASWSLRRSTATMAVPPGRKPGCCV
eukprot:15108851-Alexandrium_andersonii.AAC.1